ncbi:MAG: polysaccharide deacetylase family protein [Candidatus Latescibacterota bacterium]|nr:polysaccharide deacetylase family protein [Candidatus Latescibacterota bacterium]
MDTLPAHVPILVYHHVYREGTPELVAAQEAQTPGVIGVDEFLRQLSWLAEEGWQVVSTSQLLDGLEQAFLPTRCAVLHFDNGWIDTFEVVLPLLQERGYNATCYPITDGVEAATDGRAATVRTMTEGIVRHRFMTWQQLVQLAAAGWEIGAHTATHCRLAERHVEAGDEAVVWEAEAANALFERHLGTAPSHFAYPSGSRNERTDELLAPYYRSLRLWHFEWPIRWSYTEPQTSPHALECQNIDLRVDEAAFRRILAGEP